MRVPLGAGGYRQLPSRRFGAMLTDEYGGLKAIRAAIRYGRLVDIRLGQGHRDERHEISQPRPRRMKR